MEINLTGKKALVGGATAGLGKAISLQLAASGASVTLVSRNEEKLKSVLAQLDNSKGQQHQYLALDFTQLAAFREKMTSYFANHAVDILVNNTNGPAPGTVLEKTADDYQAAFDLLFQTVAFTTSLAIPAMQKNNFGRIINLTSQSVQEPMDNLVLSNTVRASVTAWAKTLANAVAPQGITVNNILTGIFDTARMKQLYEQQSLTSGISVEEAKKQKEQGIPVKRTGKPEEMAYLVCFLASDKSGYITGTNITIDGGAMRSL